MSIGDSQVASGAGCGLDVCTNSDLIFLFGRRPLATLVIMEVKASFIPASIYNTNEHGYNL
jgi:hypothetical protein